MGKCLKGKILKIVYMGKLGAEAERRLRERRGMKTHYTRRQTDTGDGDGEEENGESIERERKRMKGGEIKERWI